MPKYLVVALVLACLGGAAPALAADTLQVLHPAEGAAVAPPVRLDFKSVQQLPASMRLTMDLAVARGAAQTAGFQPVRWEPLDAPPHGYISALWKAEGLSGGDYTLRLMLSDVNTGQVVASALRSIRLDAPDHSPQLTLQAPDTAAGVVAVAGSVLDRDLVAWTLERTGPDGMRRPLGSGSGTLVRLEWDTTLLPDGDYTLRLAAADAAGNTAAVSRTVRVQNPPPALTVSVNTLDQAVALLPVTYAAVAPVTVRVSLGGIAGERTGDPGHERTLHVPLDLSRVTEGWYEALIRIEDAAGRAAEKKAAIQVLAPVPVPVLDALAPVTGRAVRLAWTLRGSGALRGFEVHRQGPDGSSRPAVLGPHETSYTDYPPGPGTYAYRIVALGAGRRHAQGEPGSTTVDVDGPSLGPLSISALDGVGLQMRWEAARDPADVSHYQVFLLEGGGRRLLARLEGERRHFEYPLPPGDYKAVLAAVDTVGNAAEAPPVSFRVQPGAVALLAGGAFQPADVPGFIEHDITWVPLRFFAQALGYRVTWDEVRQAAYIFSDRATVVAAPGSAGLQVIEGGSGRFIDLPHPPHVREGRLVVPLRALAEALGAAVTWHAEARTVEVGRREVLGRIAIVSPAEGERTPRIVRIELEIDWPGGALDFILEVAARGGVFRPAAWTLLPGAPRPSLQWDAGEASGPHTLRVTVRDGLSGEVVGQATRTITVSP